MGAAAREVMLSWVTLGHLLAVTDPGHGHLGFLAWEADIHRLSLLLGPPVTLPSSPRGMGKQNKTSQPVLCCRAAGFAPPGTSQSHRQQAQGRGALKRSQPGGGKGADPCISPLHQHPCAGGCGRAGCGMLELPALPARGLEEGY